MNLKRIVNIMPDNKFLDYYIEMSERFLPEQSSYVFFTDNQEFQFVKAENPNIVKIPHYKTHSKEVIEELYKAEIIIFHSFKENLLPLFQMLTGKVVLVWLFWGAEGYVTQKKVNYLGPLTSKFRFEKSMKGSLRYLKNKFFTDKKITKTGRIHREIIRKIDYGATWVNDDFDLALTINKKLKPLYFNYYTTDLMNFPDAQLIDRDLKTLLLGNSGCEYNNHAEALIYLNKIGFDGKIYCPLSYNGSKYYRKRVEDLGKTLFGEKFIPLKEFISLEKYQDIINSCDVVWMNHKRQQAAGNLFAAFYGGKIVILDSENPMLSTFRDWKLKVFNKEVLVNKEFNITDLQNNQQVEKLLTVDKNAPFFKFLKNETKSKYNNTNV